MDERLLALARRFRPELETMSVDRRFAGIGDVLAVLYNIPLAIGGLIWLIRVTNLDLIRQDPGLLLLFAVLMVIFSLHKFFLIVELGPNQYGSADGSLSGIVLWSSILLIGPSALWLAVLWSVYQIVSDWRKSTSSAIRWNLLRSFSMNLTGYTLVPLIPLSLYQAWGGVYPLPGLGLNTILAVLGVIVLNLFLLVLLWGVYLAYITWVQRSLFKENSTQPLLTFFIQAIGLNHSAHPFAILAAGLFVQNGPLLYLFFIAGMLMVAILARRLSGAAEGSRQQSRLLERLEQLGRAIINAPPGEETLPAILAEHLPDMFPAGDLVVWIFPNQILFKHPMAWGPDLEQIWPWLLRQTEVQSFIPEDTLPWSEKLTDHRPALAAPIMDIETGQTFGGFYLELHTLDQPWERQLLHVLHPAAQSLTAQIASALHQSVVYARTLEYQRVTSELKLAGSIQSRLYPSIPDIPGWQLAVTLEPAGETSGDFFDIIPLSEGKIGFVIADVLDKGVGPALYMAISRTLIRTYAVELDSQPDTVFFATNERILSDTNANLFVTAFYGVLDPETGELTYCNAGHNPPYLFSYESGAEIQALMRNAIPIGIDQDATWGNETVQINPGDALILYTDGIPEAQNSMEEFFGEENLLQVIKSNLGKSAGDQQVSILNAVHQFVGDAPQHDDITLMVLVRNP